jgi:beta-phosphoglucomutase-like phosphatase (HAD superfamily)
LDKRSREPNDAVLFDLDGVITDTANLHAACWKQMFDEYLRLARRGPAENFAPSISPQTISLMWMGSHVSDGVRDFLGHAASRFQKEHPTTRPRPKQWADLETARMIL